MDQAKLVAYLRAGQRLFQKRGDQPSVIDEDELKYKGKLIESLEKARTAVVNNRDDWGTLLRDAVWHPDNNITERSRYDPFSAVLKDWLDSEDHKADLFEAMRVLWANDGESLSERFRPGERVRAFLERAPEHDKFQTRGERLTPVSYLLMALGHNYPPFLSKNLRLTYKHLGYPPHPSKNKLDEVYEHELKFLDQLVQHSDDRPHNLLEAQSLVWQMQGLVEKAMENGNGIIENGPDPLTDPLDALGKKLLLPPTFLREIADLLEDKRQVIFQGPPGTGKTYVARKLAKFLAGSEDRVRVVQFHPSYAYEDFVQGFRPTLEDGKAGFVLRDGPLLQMADQAWSELNERHFLIIDEINRGNLSKILGELYYLLEYRADDDEADDDEADDDAFEMQLQYSDEPFAMPPNLYIIGTMNTADRSIALVDAALRRRFYFVPFHPNDPPIKGMLGRYLEKKEIQDMGGVAEFVEDANKKLDDQWRDAAIGPSYFMKENLNKEMAERIWKYNVFPYLEEQLYGESTTLNEIKALWQALWPGANADSETQDDGDGDQGGSGETTNGGGDTD